jgi:hypothetical protein
VLFFKWCIKKDIFFVKKLKIVMVKWQKGDLNSDLLRSKFLMKRCYHFTDQGHQFIMMRLEDFVVYVICFPLWREKGIHCTARKGGAGEETLPGEEDGAMWMEGGGSLKAKVLQASGRRSFGCLGADAA